MGEEKISNKKSINCREATMLSVIQEEKGLNIWRRFQLRYHSKMCKYCKLWDEQSIELNKLIKKAFSGEKHKMPIEKKEKIEKELDDLFI